MDSDQDLLSKIVEAREAASYALELVLDTVLGAYIDEADLQADVLRQIVTTCAGDSFTIVSMAEVSREGPSAPGSWQLEAEPPSCACDTWARGSLPVKQRARAPLIEASAPRQRRTSLLASLPTDSKRAAAPHPAKSKYAASVQSHNSMRRAKEDVTPAAPAIPAVEEDYEARLRNELEYRRQQAAASQQAAAREQEEKARLQHLIAKEMRGKDFSYDHKGEVVVLNKLDPEKLPPADLMLSFKVVDAVANPTGGRGTRRSSVHMPAAAIARPNKRTEKDRKIGTAGPEFVPLTSAGEFVRSDLISLQPGVTIKYASMIKSGPQRDASVGKPLTKTEYFSTVGGGFMGEEVRPLSPSSQRSRASVTPSSAAHDLDPEHSGEGAAPRPKHAEHVDPNDPAAMLAAYLRPTSQDRARLFQDAVPAAAGGAGRGALPPITRQRSRAAVGEKGRLSPTQRSQEAGARRAQNQGARGTSPSPREQRAAGPALQKITSQQSGLVHD